MDQENLRQKLQAEKQRLEEELGTIASPDETNPGGWNARAGGEDMVSRDDVAEKIEDISERKGEEVALEKQLALVEAALERLGSDTYGRCLICQAPIEEERLAASPTAQTCKAHREEVP